MRFNNIRFALAVVCACAYAQNVPPAPASLSGMVTNSLTGAPILRAHVTVTGPGMGSPESKAYGALTNQEGRFSITQIPPGSYTMSAERIGFVASNMGRSLTLGAGDKKEDVKISLTPSGAVTGRVTDSDGEPATGVEVTVETGAGSQNTTTTDGHGGYRIGGLRPGKYRVKASPQPIPFPPEIRTDGTTEVHNAATYFPGSLTRASAQRVDVRAGADNSGIDIRLVRTPVVVVSGKVAGLPPGTFRGGVQVFRDGEMNFNMGMEGTVKPDGTFMVSHLDPGKYTLVVTTYSQGPQHDLQSPPVEIEVAGANIEHVDMRMLPTFEVPGQVRFDDEKVRMPQVPQRAGQPTPAQSPNPRRQVRLQSAVGQMGSDLSAEIGADDTFAIQKVPPGRYHVNLSWGPGYVRSVRVGSTETEGDILDVHNGAAGPVTISVSALSGELSGTVTDTNGPVANGRIAIVSTAGGRRFTRTATTKADGTYTLAGIPPGKYKLAAVDDDFYPNPMNGIGLDDYDDVAEAIEIRAGDKVTKDLKKK